MLTGTHVICIKLTNLRITFTYFTKNFLSHHNFDYYYELRTNLITTNLCKQMKMSLCSGILKNKLLLYFHHLIKVTAIIGVVGTEVVLSFLTTYIKSFSFSLFTTLT